MPITVASIRRYPVKSMGGEALDVAEVDQRGLVGDRWYAVVDDDGRFASGKSSRRFKRRDHVFDYTARTRDDGHVMVSDGQQEWRAGDQALDVELSRVMRAVVRVEAEASVMHYDAAPVSIVGTATLGWCADRWAADADPRRFRVNLVVATDEPFVEETWIGSTIEVGSCRLAVTQQVERCRMIDIDQDGAVASGQLLKPLTRERDAMLATYATVARPGAIRVGDEVLVG